MSPGQPPPNTLRVAGITAIVGGAAIILWSHWPDVKARYYVYRMTNAPYETLARYEARLMMMGPSASGALRSGLQSADPMSRRAFAWLLGRTGDPAAAGTLIAALDDPEPNVRWRAAEALGALASKDAVPRLLRALRDPDPRVRAYSACALGWIAAPAAFLSLTTRVDDPDAFVRRDALWSLARIDPRRAQPYLEAGCRDPEPLVRGMAEELARGTGQMPQFEAPAGSSTR